jgi:hypothetical protein
MSREWPFNHGPSLPAHDIPTDGEQRVGLTVLYTTRLTIVGSDKADALPSVSSNKEKSGEAGTVEDVQRVSCGAALIRLPDTIQDMRELDASFQVTVQRAVAPYREVSAPDPPSMDVSALLMIHTRSTETSQAELEPGPKQDVQDPPRRRLAPLQCRSRHLHPNAQRAGHDRRTGQSVHPPGIQHQQRQHHRPHEWDVYRQRPDV